MPIGTISMNSVLAYSKVHVGKGRLCHLNPVTLTNCQPLLAFSITNNGINLEMDIELVCLKPS